MVNPSPPRRLKVKGGWAARVIDLANPEPALVVVWHSDDPRFPADGICARERLAVPPGSEIDLRCPDCASAVVEFGGDLAAVAAQRLGAALIAGVAHSPSCLWLARQLLGGAA
jgi:hypothetical protein